MLTPVAEASAVIPLVVGTLLLIAGFLVRIAIHWGELDPKAKTEVRGPAAFLVAYFGPELILFSLSLFALSPRQNGKFSSVLFLQVVFLLFSILAWMVAGAGRYIPIGEREVLTYGADGIRRVVRTPVILWREGLTRWEGLLVLVVGNLVGAASFGSYVLYLTGRL